MHAVLLRVHVLYTSAFGLRAFQRPGTQSKGMQNEEDNTDPAPQSANLGANHGCTGTAGAPATMSRAAAVAISNEPKDEPLI